MKDVKKYINLFNKHSIEYNENYLESYNINTDCKFIGVTGSRGKSSTCYLLYQYLIDRGYKVCLWSSAGVFNPNTYYIQGEPVMWTATLEEMSDFVAAAEQYMADYVIIECNAEAINRGIFNNLEFDYKVLTLFEETDNQHMDADKYFKTKLNFFTINPCKSILNIDGDHVEDFLNACNDKFTFSNEKTSANLYGTFMLPYVDKTYIEFKLDNKEESIISTLPLEIGGKISLTLLGLLAGMGEYEANKEKIKNFLAEKARVEGRVEDIQWKNRTIMIDSGNEVFINETLTYLNSEKFKTARQHYIDKFGEDFIKTEYNNIRVLFSCIGGIDNYVIENLKSNKDFVFKNTVSDTNADVRRNFLVFGTNLYVLLNKCSSLQAVANKFVKAGRNPFAINEILEEIDTTNFPDHSTQTILDQNYLDDLYTALCQRMESLEKGYKISFYQNFAWRSIVTLKDFFSDKTHLNDFYKLTDYFKTLNCTELTAACDFIGEKLNLVREQYEESVSKINSIDSSMIKKLYLTFTQYNADGTEAMLEKTAQSLSKNINYEAIVDRQDAIRKMILESNEGDLLLICGRGTRSDYLQSNGRIVFITDKEMLNNVIK